MELRACPFCRQPNPEFDEKYNVHVCRSCGAEGPDPDYRYEKFLTPEEAWNGLDTGTLDI